jgi:hypothetical protein
MLLPSLEIRGQRSVLFSPLPGASCHSGRFSDLCSLISLSNLAGAEGFEPPSSVLETDSLAVELTPLNTEISGQRSEISSFLAAAERFMPARPHILISVL